MNCKYCGTDDPNMVVKARTNKHSITRLYCLHCKKYTDDFGAPKILLFDIEVSRTLYSLYPGKQYVGGRNVEARAYMLGWTAKWLFDDTVTHAWVTPKEAVSRDDKRISKKLHKIISDADLVIAHNGDKYDIKKINWFFALHDLQPNNRYLTLDTYTKSKQIFGAESCSLNYLLQQFGFVGKDHIHEEDWQAVERGNPAAIRKAKKYCDRDVYGLEELYLKIRGWMKSHPNMYVYYEMYHTLNEDENLCPRCGQTINDQKWTKKWQTPAGTIYKSCNCPSCSAVLKKPAKRGFIR